MGDNLREEIEKLRPAINHGDALLYINELTKQLTSSRAMIERLLKLWRTNEIQTHYSSDGKELQNLISEASAWLEERPKDFKFCPYCGGKIKEVKP